mgnify:CR=1 FL=1
MGLDLGADDYVTKPFNQIELQARMRSCLRLKSELDRRRSGENRGARRRAVQSFSEATVPSLFGSKGGFQGNLMSLSPAMQKDLGLIVFRIDGDRDQSDAARGQRQELQHLVAGFFARSISPPGTVFPIGRMTCSSTARFMPITRSLKRGRSSISLPWQRRRPL